MSPALLPLAAAAPALTKASSIWDQLEFQLVGLTIVLCTLAGIYVTCSLVGAVFRRLEARQATSAPAPAATARGAEEAAAEGEALTPELLAVIAAAAAAVVAVPHRLVDVRPAPENVVWSLEGRRQHFASHQLPRR